MMILTAWELPGLPNKKRHRFRCLFLSQRKSACNKKSLLWCIEYGILSASRNILLEILRISFLYGLRLAKTILCLRASPGLRFSPRNSLTILMSIATWPGTQQDCQIKKTPFQVSLFIWQLPILPGRFQPSTFGVCELNFRVRHGNGCILTAIATISEGCSFKTI